MAKERLLELDWFVSQVSFDLLALTTGSAPGDVRWRPADRGQDGREPRKIIQTLLDEPVARVMKKVQTVEQLIIKRDEDLIGVGVGVAGDQVLLVGRALPMMGPGTRAAVSDALARGNEYWALSFWDVVNGVAFERRGATSARRVVMMSGDHGEFESSGNPLLFESPHWDGTTNPSNIDDDANLDVDEEGGDVDEDDELPVQETLAKAALTEWIAGASSIDQLLQSEVLVLKFDR